MTQPKRVVARVATAITAAAATVALAGCAGTAEPSTGPLLMYTWISSDGDRAQWESFISEAQKVDPDVDVTIEGPSFSDYWTKVKTRLSGGETVCLLTTQASRAQELDALLMPLDELIAENDFDLSDIDPSMLAGMTVGGTIRAIPYDAEPIVTYYNADAFRAAGLDLPTTTYTRDQFVSDAAALTTDGHYGYALAPGMFIPNAWALADGVPAVSANGQLDLTNPAFAEQIQSYFDLVAVDGIARAPEPGEASEVAQQAFINGDTDILIEGPWWYGTFADAVDFELGMTIVPSTSGEASAMTAGSGFGIAKTCDRPQEAFEAIVALTSQEVQEAQAAERGIVPARISAVPAWAEGKPQEAADVISALLGNATAQITTTTWSQVETLMGQYGVEGYRGERTAEDILTIITDSVGG